MNNGKIQSFTDLHAWQEGHALVLLVYEITKTFPNEEKFSITDQMRRAATSVTANIAEGFGRQTYKEKAQFYYLAQGSLTELKNFLLVCRDIHYLNEMNFNLLVEQSNNTHKLLQGLIQKTKSFINP